MTKRAQTHIYLEGVLGASILVTEETAVAVENIELYDKSLVLTADLKQLPFLVGGGLQMIPDVSILNDLQTAGLDGATFTLVLLNGDYSVELLSIEDGRYSSNILDIPRRRKDVLLVAHFLILRDITSGELAIVQDPSQWDFEGDAILYDTITLALFADGGAAATGAGFGGYGHGEALLEIDWKSISAKELDEFIRESIFARGSGSET